MKILIYPNFSQVTMTITDKAQLLSQIDTDSILLDPLVNYRLEMGKSMNQQIQPESFRIGSEVIVTKDGVELKGILKNLTDDKAEIEIDNEVLCRIKNYSSVLQEINNSINTITVGDVSNLSYLFHSVGWTPIYTINLAEDIASISCTANIYSYSELTADISLIAGSFSSTVRMNSTSDKYDQFHSYDLGNTTIKDTETVHIFAESGLEVSNFYTHDVSSEVVNHGYSFISPRFLPEGKVYFYDQSRYIGIFEVKETLESSAVELIIGQTTEVTCLSTIQSQESEGIMTTILKTKIINEKNCNVDLTIKYYIGKSTLLSSSIPITERQNDFLEWDLVIDDVNLFEVEIITN